jgi:hypothetical protein
MLAMVETKISRDSVFFCESDRTENLKPFVMGNYVKPKCLKETGSTWKKSSLVCW